ncbi:jg12012 [Pararge aegeria aegeria]|uniref:Jg12012 protein n=1 Tax=Pararge aegeria aegeria TaxID=348720 RepID=A0A8S4R8A9_9NEOP|nr:jg12012 [Pararge aegeria aegeria]
MKLIIFIYFSSFILYGNCGLLSGILGEDLDLSNGKVVNNVVNTLGKQTKGVVDDLGDLLGPKDKNERPNVENDMKDIERQDKTTPATGNISAAPVKQDENKKLTPAEQMATIELQPTAEVNKMENKEESTTESFTSISTSSKETTNTEKN